MTNSFWLNFFICSGNSEGLRQFRLKTDLSDLDVVYLSPFKVRLIFPDDNFLTISYIVEDTVVVFPSSNTSTLFTLWIKIKSKSVAVIVFELFASIKIFDKIGSASLFYNSLAIIKASEICWLILNFIIRVII